MPIFSMQLDNPSLSHWKIFRLEKDIMLMFGSPNTQVVSCTWLEQHKVTEFSQWATGDPNRHTVFISMMDPCSIQFPAHDRIHYLGGADIVYFALLVGKHFFDYIDHDLAPQFPFENRFLCYQRKRSQPRIDLYNALRDQQGIVTLSGEHMPAFNDSVPVEAGLLETTMDNIESLNPNDMWSLGDLGVWRGSFLNIVSETVQHHNGLDRVFASEKTFKPILGMRPFLHYGEADFSGLLQSRGFETFDEDFEYNPSAPYDQQAAQLANIIQSLDNPEDMYKKLLPKITHNRNHLHTMVQAEWKKVQQLADHYCSLC